MDGYGLTELEKNYNLHEYNHALFANMKAFMDSCWEINLTTNTVVILHNTLKPEYIGREFEYERMLSEYGEHYIYPFDRKLWYQMFSLSSLKNLKQETSTDVHIIGSTSIPEICRIITTPAFNKDGSIDRVYLSSRNVESDILMLREMQEEKQIIFAAMEITYPIIIYSNLTRNSYMIYMLTEHKFDIPIGGTYDSLINIFSENIPQKYRDEYINTLSRSKLKEKLTNDGQFVEIEYEQIMDGTSHWFISKTVRINNPYNEDFMAITLISIIDEQHHNEYVAKMAMQDAYRAALDAEKAKSEFLSRMSHEMLTPLNTVQGLVTLAMDDETLSAEQKHIMEEIDKANKRLNAQISRLLDTSLLEARTITLSEAPSEICSELNNAVEQIKEAAEEKDIELEIISNEIIHNDVICDSTRIGQVFGALLSNAVKFTHNGGTVKAELKEGKGRRSGFGYYTFTVTDNGIGIEEKYLDRIFEPFERVEDSRISRNCGSGLGLYIVKNITKMLGGNVTVKSVYSKGSQFTASFFLKLDNYLKAAQYEAPKPSYEENKSDHISFKGKRILVVEDNDINNEIICEILRSMDFDVQSAYDGSEAVQAVLESDPGCFDIVLMDIMMPITDGHEATRIIRNSGREDLKTIPIIAASANSFPSDIESSLKNGMNDHIAKPIERNALAKVLKQWIKD